MQKEWLRGKYFKDQYQVLTLKLLNIKYHITKICENLLTKFQIRRLELIEIDVSFGCDST